MTTKKSSALNKQLTFKCAKMSQKNRKPSISWSAINESLLFELWEEKCSVFFGQSTKALHKDAKLLPINFKIILKKKFAVSRNIALPKTPMPLLKSECIYVNITLLAAIILT
ncbi:uncharacterized protein LOC133850706 [Drosophila sulfurigaster albostrigata]|uniref:uncharacterized protein LOC133850706 n=1 Tax=Drosophila sulfurigaster albostrigata TaxID=89887 RepID=UPI002D21E0B4|nr:uncharacterized protein LOC133850706 [Drosophila sulfurigaster albostrigata]